MYPYLHSDVPLPRRSDQIRCDGRVKSRLNSIMAEFLSQHNFPFKYEANVSLPGLELVSFQKIWITQKRKRLNNQKIMHALECFWLSLVPNMIVESVFWKS